MESPTKQAIARAAEVLFSRRSYEAVSIREIAAAAGVHFAVIRYHFGTKEALYQALFERRYATITRERVQRLRALHIAAGSIESLRAIVEVWIHPLIELANDPDSRSFVELLAREGGDSENDRRGIFARHLNPAARCCIEALQRVAPHAHKADVVQGYLWMTAAAMSTVAGSRRQRRLLGQPGRREAPQALAPTRLIEFVSGGLAATLLARERTRAQSEVRAGRTRVVRPVEPNRIGG